MSGVTRLAWRVCTCALHLMMLGKFAHAQRISLASVDPLLHLWLLTCHWFSGGTEPQTADYTLTAALYGFEPLTVTCHISRSAAHVSRKTRWQTLVMTCNGIPSKVT